MTRTEALQLLIDKCPEIVGPMLPGTATVDYLLVYGVDHSFNDDDFDALEARMGRWLRDEHDVVLIPAEDDYSMFYIGSGVEVLLKGALCLFIAHALAVIALATQEVKGE